MDVVTLDEFQSQFHWTQGEHITLLGPTGYGKSTLTRLILPQRQYSVVFATKRKDDTMDKLERQGYKVQKRFRPEVENRIILKPHIDPDDDTDQRQEFSSAMSEIFWSGGWCINWDEAVYLSEELRLKKKMSNLWMQGRSLKISIVAGTQRPAFLPLYAYDQATHFFFWKMRLQDDVMRVARLGGLDIGPMVKTLRSLPKYTFMYHNKDSETTLICKPEVQ